MQLNTTTGVTIEYRCLDQGELRTANCSSAGNWTTELNCTIARTNQSNNLFLVTTHVTLYTMHAYIPLHTIAGGITRLAGAVVSSVVATALVSLLLCLLMWCVKNKLVQRKQIAQAKNTLQQ